MSQWFGRSAVDHLCVGVWVCHVGVSRWCVTLVCHVGVSRWCVTLVCDVGVCASLCVAEWDLYFCVGCPELH